MFYLKIKVDGTPPLPNNAKKHWYLVNESRKLWHRKVFHHLVVKPEHPLKKCRIVCTRYSSRKPDYDNLVYSFKPVVDALVIAGIIIDDDLFTIVDRKYFWVKTPEKQKHITVYIEEVSEQEEGKIYAGYQE